MQTTNRDGVVAVSTSSDDDVSGRAPGIARPRTPAELARETANAARRYKRTAERLAALGVRLVDGRLAAARRQILDAVNRHRIGSVYVVGAGDDEEFYVVGVYRSKAAADAVAKAVYCRQLVVVPVELDELDRELLGWWTQ